MKIEPMDLEIKHKNNEELKNAIDELDSLLEPFFVTGVKEHSQSFNDLVDNIEKHLPLKKGVNPFEYFYELKNKYPEDFSRLRFDDTEDGKIYSQNLDFIFEMLEYNIDNPEPEKPSFTDEEFKFLTTEQYMMIDHDGFRRLLDFINGSTNLKKVQEEISQWTTYNFGTNRDYITPFLGVVEEVGELSHALLKQKQDIRINENHEENIKDAVGDIFIFLLDFCNLKGYNFGEILTKTWSEVRERDWVNDKEKGAI